jgi:hypothetical protein
MGRLSFTVAESARFGGTGECPTMEAVSGMFEILFAEDVADDLADLEAGERTKILDRIEVQLKYEPPRQTRNRKILVGLI